MNVEIGAEAALFPEKEYINGIFVAVHALLLVLAVHGGSEMLVCQTKDNRFPLSRSHHIMFASLTGDTHCPFSAKLLDTFLTSSSLKELLLYRIRSSPILIVRVLSLSSCLF
jgi:hypothetical protein